MIAVDQLEGEHLRNLVDFARHFQQQGPGAAIAEVDHHVRVFGFAAGGRGGANTQFQLSHTAKRLAGRVEQSFQADDKILGQRGWTGRNILLPGRRRWYRPPRTAGWRPTG